MRAFQKDVARCRGDGGRLSAHHAGHCQRAAVIGDQQKPRIERDLAAPQQDQALALAGVPHRDVTAQCVVVEGVQRLTQFEHHVVGDIDHRIDSP